LHQSFNFLNIFRCIHTMGIVVHFDHLQLRKKRKQNSALLDTFY
jgi:hypothetical protein